MDNSTIILGDNWHVPPDSAGHALWKVNVALMTVSCVIMATRLIIRGFVIRSLGIDDLVATVALGFLLANSSLELQAIKNGSGTHIEEVPPPRLLKFFSLLATLRLLYFWVIGTVRLSVVAFFPRLKCDEKWFILSIYAISFLISASTLIPFFWFLTDCKHIPDLWDITIPSRDCRDATSGLPMLWASSAVGIFIDLCLFAVPVLVIRRTMKFSPQLIQVTLVFSVGIFVIIAGVVRMAMLITTDYLTDTTYTMVRLSPWTNLEGHIGLWTASFPALQPMLRGIGNYLDKLRGKSPEHKGTGHKFLMNSTDTHSRSVSVA